MKIKGSIIIFIITIMLIGISCNKIDLPKDTPRCIKQKIKDEQNSSCLQNVYQYSYKNKKAYLFEIKNCPDLGNSVFDEDCNSICGSFWGGSNCQEFHSLATDKTLIWSKE